MTPTEFFDAVLVPAFNDNDEIAQADEFYGSMGDGHVVWEVVTADGTTLQVSVSRTRRKP